jgi:hypothetical protein
MELSEIGLSRAMCENISELINSGHMPHAILIDAGSEAKRSALALYIAEAFVCSSDKKPCRKCNGCVKVESGIHPDVLIYDPNDSNEKTFKVSAVRDIRQNAYIIPNEAENKVFVLKQADKMNSQAQNALLKILEEPPSHVVFILECESRAAMLPTIMSRVTSFNLGADDYELTDEMSEKADSLAVSLSKSLMNPTELEFLKLSSAFENNKELFQPVMLFLQLIFRDAAALKTGSNVTLTNHIELCRSLCEKFSLNTLINLTENADNFYRCVDRNANKNLLITRFCSVMRNTAYKE